MPLFQNESTRRTNLSYEIDFVFHEHERSFHMNVLTRRFVLTQAKGNLKIAYSEPGTTQPRWLTFKIGLVNKCLIIIFPISLSSIKFTTFPHYVFRHTGLTLQPTLEEIDR